MLNVNEADIDRVTEAIHRLLRGDIPNPVDLPPGYPENELRQLVQYVNALIGEYAALAESMAALSRGDLEFNVPKGRMRALQSMKNLHANLRHLTWKTQQIARGDFSQRVDFMGEFSSAFNEMTRQLKAAFDTIERQNRELEEANRVIQSEKDKSDRLLLNVLPARIADQLKQTGRTTPELFKDVTVLFSDFVGFTRLAFQMPPEILIEELNEIFTAFDEIFEANGCERIKTIGDAYLAVCGMPAANPGHAVNVLRAAVEVVRWLRARNQTNRLQWQARIGIHTGPVVGSVVGIKKYIYDVFGDTVNTASRMESLSEPMGINVSETSFDRLKDSGAVFIKRPPAEVKGKGPMQMYLVDIDATRLKES
jgi:class 3 adenylate cyclase